MVILREMSETALVRPEVTLYVGICKGKLRKYIRIFVAGPARNLYNACYKCTNCCIITLVIILRKYYNERYNMLSGRFSAVVEHEKIRLTERLFFQYCTIIQKGVSRFIPFIKHILQSKSGIKTIYFI